MSALPVMDDDGRISVPREIREAAGLRSGDSFQFRVIGPREVAFAATENQQSNGSVTVDCPADSPATFQVTDSSVDWSTVELPKMSLDEFLAKYGPGEPIDDWQTFREAAEAEQGDELVRRIRAGLE